MDKKMNVFTRLGFSINPKKYIYLVKDSFLKVMGYVLLLATVFGLIQGIASMSMLTIIEKSTKVAFEEERLKFEMKDGILDFKASPFKEEQGSILLLIDTSISVNEVDSLRNITVHKELSTVFLKDGLMVKNGTDEIKYKYSEIGLNAVDFDNETIVTIVDKFGTYKYLIIPILIVARFINMIFFAFMISLAGLLSKVLNKQVTSYGTIFKLSLYAITLPTLISVIIPLGKLEVFVGGFVLIIAINILDNKNKVENI